MGFYIFFPSCSYFVIHPLSFYKYEVSIPFWRSRDLLMFNLWKTHLWTRGSLGLTFGVCLIHTSSTNGRVVVKLPLYTSLDGVGQRLSKPILDLTNHCSSIVVVLSHCRDVPLRQARPRPFFFFQISFPYSSFADKFAVLL